MLAMEWARDSSRGRAIRTPIRYAHTSDGVNLAYVSQGTGIPALIVGDPLFTHLERYWPQLAAVPGVDSYFQHCRIMFYSPRGFGLSDRDVGETTLEQRITDIDTVLDHAGVEKVALLATGNAGITALLYAAARPERVSELVLYMFWSNQVGMAGGLGQLLESNWDLYTVLLGQIIAGRSKAQEGPEIAELLRASGSQQQYIRWLHENASVDLAEILPQVETPTLVLCREERLVGNISPIAGARRITGTMRNASLQLLPGDHYTIDESAMSAALDFVLEHQEHEDTGTVIRTILFTDLQGHNQIVQRLGDAAALPVLRRHEEITRRALHTHGGADVKALGDGFMASFPSAQRALDCAMELQRAFEAHSETSDEPLQIRVGVNAGEPIAEDDDLFGTAVITASRLAGMADGGEILVSGVVRELAAGKSFLFAERGEAVLRGFEDPVRIFELQWRDDRAS